MKKTIKLLIIFIGGLTVIIVGALTGYFLISKNKTFYIYDVRFVEPIEGIKGYVYGEVVSKADLEKQKKEEEESGVKKENEELTKYQFIKNQKPFRFQKKTVDG